jgi:2'-5' RNA ligase
VSIGDHDSSPSDRMENHWWWRPGWKQGRSAYAWHLTFDHADDLQRLAADYAGALSVPGLDVIPPRWLHLTMQGVGFTDEIPNDQVDAIVTAARTRLAGLAPFEVILGPTVTEPEVVRLQVEPAALVAAVRIAIRTGMADVWGAGRVPDAADDFIPHVSLAYSSSDGPAAPIAAAAAAVRVQPARATITEARLIVLNRDQKQYQWTTYATAPLGG